MKVQLYAKLGGKFLNDDNLRIEQLKIENENFQKIKEKLFKKEEDKLDKNPILYIKGYGNNPELLNSFKNLIFTSRELIDSTLLKLNTITKDQPHQTSKKFPVFVKQLLEGLYEPSRMLNFIKINLTFLFHIRKVRNIIKTNPSLIEFRMITNHLRAHLIMPLSDDELYLIPSLDIKGKDKALENKSYHATFILDKYYPEMVEFWKTTESVFKT